jgi:hypothetical protein
MYLLGAGKSVVSSISIAGALGAGVLVPFPMCFAIGAAVFLLSGGHQSR